ncbi:MULTISPECIES: hypothetical protein [Actinomycetes]|uniref:hypothetical protein n=1 Tax=Actinomycetes TaxID=1760 RepID=UPI0012DBE501|nr:MULTISPECIES: hypothetical protein [Actinomycetes]
MSSTIFKSVSWKTTAVAALASSLLIACSNSGSPSGDVGVSHEEPAAQEPGGACSLLSDSEAAEAIGVSGGYSHFEVTDSGAVAFDNASQCQWTNNGPQALFITVMVKPSPEDFNSACESGPDGYGNLPIPVANIGESACYLEEEYELWFRIGDSSILVTAADQFDPNVPPANVTNVAHVVAQNYTRS